MNSTLTITARETAVVYESEFPGKALDPRWLGEAYEIDSAARKIGRTGYAAYKRAVTAALAGIRRAAAARALRAIPSEARSEQSRANGRRGGRPVILGTIAVDGGRATVRYAPGLGRVEGVLPDGTVEVPEDASVASLEEARETAEAWYGRDRRAWDWQPR